VRRRGVREHENAPWLRKLNRKAAELLTLPLVPLPAAAERNFCQFEMSPPTKAGHRIREEQFSTPAVISAYLSPRIHPNSRGPGVPPTLGPSSFGPAIKNFALAFPTSPPRRQFTNTAPGMIEVTSGSI